MTFTQQSTHATFLQYVHANPIIIKIPQRPSTNSFHKPYSK